MKAPPLLLACAALFWGWQSGHWTAAAIAAVLLEAPRVVPQRWSFDPAELNRIADFCLLLAAGLGVYFYFSFGNPRAITLLFQWLPVALLPLALALVWSAAASLPLSVLFIGLRRQTQAAPRSIDAGYPFLALWLLAASAANHRDSGFYWGAVALLAWPLWLHRPRSFAPPAWVAMVMAAIAFGHAGHVGLNLLQTWLEGAAPEWLSNSGSRTDPYRSTTDMGSIGELKESETIVLRLSAPAGRTRPILLHRASYDYYFGGTWAARNGRFALIDPAAPSATPPVMDQGPIRRYVVHEFSPGGNPVLSLPDGTLRIAGLGPAPLRRNPMGAVQADLPPGYLGYSIETGSAARDAVGASAPPGVSDLTLPAAEAALLHDIVRGAGLANRAPAQLPQALKDYFSAGYSYSTFQENPGAGHTPLADFLLATHAGHCEYFATATVLLARAAGVPARYATGFSAQEYSRLEQAYVVRERHAHAWAQLYVDGRWQDVDTTPPSWIAIENARAPRWQPLYDALSWARFRLAEQLAGDRNPMLYGGAALLALVAITWFFKRKGRKAPACSLPADAGPARAAAQPGRDSEFYAVERRLAELGWHRGRAEPLLDWLDSLKGDPRLGGDTLAALARLHYRHRFDPRGLAPRERATLREAAQEWLARHPAATS
jgi:hypothetical protein